jgi:hypothetical protein
MVHAEGEAPGEYENGCDCWLILPSGEQPQGAYCVFTAETTLTPLPLVWV